MVAQQDLDQAITKLGLLHEDTAVLDVISCGKRAIPALRDILLARERSGLYQVRCRAVEALADLGATNILVEYLEMQRVIADPVERLGEDAVINAAARSLADVHDPRVFSILLRLGRHAHLTGVIKALGASGRPEAIPALIAALEDDASRPTAQVALRRLGRKTRGALFNAATMQLPGRERESASSVRRRQSALGLLAEIGVARGAWAVLRHLVDDADAKIAFLACEICLKCAAAAERSRAVRRLIELLVHPDWLRREDSERLLLAHYSVTIGPIAAYLREQPLPNDDALARKQKETALRHIIARAKPPHTLGSPLCEPVLVVCRR
jgi:HEAT repeat protein